MSRPEAFQRNSFLEVSRAAVLFAFILLLTLIACGGRPAPGPGGSATGSSPGGSGSGSGGGNSAGPVSGAPGTSFSFVYVVDSSPQQIETFKMEHASGVLTSAGAPFMVGHAIQNLSVSSNGKFGYGVANDFVNNNFINVLLAFSFDSTSGLPVLIQATTLGGGSGGSTAIDPTGRFVFVSVDSNNTTGSGIAVFTIQSNGALIQTGATMPTDVNPGHIVVDAKDRFLFTDTSATNKVWGYLIDPSTGALTRISNTPFIIQRSVPQAGKEPTNFNEVLDPAGQRLFVVDNINSRINVFTVNQTTGVITFQGATTSPQFEELFAPAIDPKGRFLYIAAFNTNAITGFSVINASNPAFPVIPGLPVTTSGAPNWWMIVDPTSTFVYSVEVDAVGDIGRLDGYQIQQNAGTLTRLPSTPVILQGSPAWIAMGP